MALTYQIHAAHRLVVVTGTGVLDHADLDDLSQRMADDPEFDSTFSRLVDYRQATVPPARDDRVLDHVNHVRHSEALAAPGKTAIVASSAAVFGLSRMFSTYTADIGREYQVFRSLDEAKAWLELPSWPAGL